MASLRSTERYRRLYILRQQQAQSTIEAFGDSSRHEDSDESKSIDAIADSQPDELDRVLTETQQRDVREFFEACGGGPTPQLVVDGPHVDETETHSFHRPFLLIGRSNECDLRFSHADVSFRHAYLQMIEGRLLGIDLATRTGTHWTTGPKGSDWIEAGERIQIGPYSIRMNSDEYSIHEDLEDLSGSSIVVPSPEARRQDLPEVYLEFLNCRDPSQDRRHVLIERSITMVGWNNACKIRLRDDTVSKVHASLVLTDNGLWVVDLLGRGGTKVNGKVVSYARLADGGELAVGKFEIGVRYGPPGQRWKPKLRPPTKSRSKRRKTEGPERHLSLRSTGGGDVGRDEITRSGNQLAMPQPADATLPAHQQTGVSEQLVIAMINQFASMQQHIFEQSNQFMMLMTNMFSSMHQSQMNLIREDLRRVHEINHELQDIQRRLLQEGRLQSVEPAPEEQQGRGGASPASATSAQSAGNSLVTSIPRMSGEIASDTTVVSTPEAQPPTTQDEQDSEPASEDQPAEPWAATTRGSAVPDHIDHSEESADFEPDVEDELIDDDERVDEERTFQETVPVDSTQDYPDDFSNEPPKDLDPLDAHAWLAKRMAVLENERNSRWRKMLNMLTGGPEVERG